MGRFSVIFSLKASPVDWRHFDEVIYAKHNRILSSPASLCLSRPRHPAFPALSSASGTPVEGAPGALKLDWGLLPVGAHMY